MANTPTGGPSASMRIQDEDWNEMMDRRDKLDEDIGNAFSRRSIRTLNSLIRTRSQVSKELIKMHNMRERDSLATYRKQLDDLKTELSTELSESGTGATGSENQQASA